MTEIAYEHFYNFSKVWGEKYVTSNVQIINPSTGQFEYIGKSIADQLGKLNSGMEELRHEFRNSSDNLRRELRDEFRINNEELRREYSQPLGRYSLRRRRLAWSQKITSLVSAVPHLNE